MSGVVWISWGISGVGKRIGEEGCSIGRFMSTGIGVSSRSLSLSSGLSLSVFFPLSVDDSEAGVEGPAVELAEDELGIESLGRRMELRHERLESAG
jgi:hypothetical protein